MRSEEGPCRSVHANLHLPKVRSCDLLPTHWIFFSLWARDTLDGNRRNVELVTALIEMFVHPLTAEHPNSRPRRKSATDRASPENQQERICSLSSRSFLPLRQQGEGKARKEREKKKKALFVRRMGVTTILSQDLIFHTSNNAGVHNQNETETVPLNIAIQKSTNRSSHSLYYKNTARACRKVLPSAGCGLWFTLGRIHKMLTS